MRITNKRISDLCWDDEARAELEQALMGASRDLIDEAFAFVSPDGSIRIGPHHEVRDDVMVVSRDAVYACASRMRDSAARAAEGIHGEGLPYEERRLRRSERVKALQHLGRHLRDMQDVQLYEGE